MLEDLPDPRRVAEFRRRGGGFDNELWASSVTITDSGVWINGRRVPWFMRRNGVHLEWEEPHGDDSVRVGRLVLEILVTDDDTIIVDTRPPRIEAEIVPDGT